MALGSFLSALGQAFTGYSQDEAGRELQSYRQAELAHQQRQDTMAQQLHGAQMDNYNAEALMRNQRAQQEAFMRTPEFQTRYRSAMNGSKDDEAWVRSMVSGHPNEAPILAPFNRAPVQPHYDAARGGYVSPAGGFSPVQGLPPIPEKPSDLRGDAAQQRLERTARKGELQSGVTASKGALDEAIKAVPRPSKVQGGIAGNPAIAMNPQLVQPGHPKGLPLTVPNPAYEQAVKDSTQYEGDVIKPARANYNTATSDLQRFIGGGQGSGPAPSTRPDPATRAAQLKAQGKSRADVAAIMRAEGYDVHDSGGPKPP